MLCASTGNTTRKDLTSLRYILLQLSCILVIDYVIFTTEYANFLSSAHTAFFLIGESVFSVLLKAIIITSYRNLSGQRRVSAPLVTET